MFVVAEIHDNSLGKAWVFPTLEEAVDQAVISVREMKCGCAHSLTDEDREYFEMNFAFWCGNRAVCIGQTEN